MKYACFRPEPPYTIAAIVVHNEGKFLQWSLPEGFNCILVSDADVESGAVAAGMVFNPETKTIEAATPEKALTPVDKLAALGLTPDDILSVVNQKVLV